MDATSTGGSTGTRKGPGPVPTLLMLAFLVGAAHGIYDRWRAPAAPAAPRASKADIAGTIGKLDLAARRKAIAGAWVVRGGEGGYASDYTQPMAIEIDATSDKVTIWDGREQRTARLQLDGPCSLSLMQPDKENGGEGGPSYAMLVHDGVAQIGGIDDGGERVGDGAVVCTGFVYVMDDDGDCARVAAFDRKDGSTETSGDRAECGFRKDDQGKPVFYYKDPSFPDQKEETLPVDGWRIGRAEEHDPTDPNKDAFHRYRDFVAARAVVDADARANDPLLIARAAGGKAGDTSTVANLVATYATDRDGLDGKVVRVAGVVVADGTYDRHVLATPDHLTAPTVTCEGPLEALAIGTPVLVEGKVTSGFDTTWTRRPFAAPALDECKLITGAP